MCDGQIMSISQNQALFALLGTSFGGDGRTSFALPDLRGRVPIHRGQGPGLLDYRLGTRGGSESMTLGVAQMPAHTHEALATSESTSTSISTLHGTASNAGSISPSSASLAVTTATKGAVKNYLAQAPNVDMISGSVTTSTTTNTSTDITLSNTGGNQAISLIQPFTVLNCIIALEGTFPSRS